MDDPSPVKLKIDLARAQLGTATELFVRDRDPISVHVLSCGACELLEGIGKTGGVGVFSTLILKNQPQIDMAKVVRLRNQHWNAMKHFYKRDNETVRDDTELLASFSDRENDTAGLVLCYQRREARRQSRPSTLPNGYNWEPKRLTWYGHEFLDNVRDPEVWRKTKEGAAKPVDSALKCWRPWPRASSRNRSARKLESTSSSDEDSC